MIHPKHKKQIDKWIDSELKGDLQLETLSPTEIEETKKPVGCMTCPREVDFKKFRKKDYAEFQITGMCKHCQNEVFNPRYEDGTRI